MKKYFFLLIGVALISQSCMKDDCGECYNPPATFGFTLLPLEDNSSQSHSEEKPSLIPSVYKLDSISLYYYDGNEKKSVNLQYGTSNYLGVYLVSTDISVVSVNKNIKNFYLYLNHQDTDTIYFSSKIVVDGCCSGYAYDSISYNGKNMLRHQASGLLYVIKPQP